MNFLSEIHIPSILKHLKLPVCTPIQLCDGITNKLYRAGSVLIRFYGNNTHLLVNRDQEVKVMMSLSKHSFGPMPIARFPNGLIYPFVEGESGVNVELNYEKIALHVREWHSLSLDIPKFDYIGLMQRWHSLNPGLVHFKDIEFCRKQLPKSKLVLTHNDLLPGNIIMRPDGVIRFIDFEYSGMGLAAFDIANHFLEWAGLECDYTKLPSRELQRKWLESYLGHPDINELLNEVNLCVPICHLFWTLWAQVQAEQSNLDFDYLSFAKKRYQRFLME